MGRFTSPYISNMMFENDPSPPRSGRSVFLDRFPAVLMFCGAMGFFIGMHMRLTRALIVASLLVAAGLCAALVQKVRRGPEAEVEGARR